MFPSLNESLSDYFDHILLCTVWTIDKHLSWNEKNIINKQLIFDIIYTSTNPELFATAKQHLMFFNIIRTRQFHLH